LAAPRQLGRAPRRGYQRPIFEELPALDCRWLARHNLVPRDWRQCAYDFSFIVPQITRLTLTAHNADVMLRDGREQSIPITWQRNAGIGHGSIRPMFICDCQRRAFRMYDLYGTLCCKHCAIRRGAVYASQQQSAKGRAALQAMRLRHFLGGWVGLTPSKPALMHKSTYGRLANKLRQLEAKGSSKSVTKLSDRLVRPQQMYRTQVASIANA
jgi:hypothetical protein